MILEFLIIILGLSLFEIITSIDNAVINAHVLKTLPEKFRRFFLFWGIFFAVFVIRGVLPFLIVWIANTNLSVVQVITFAFSKDAGIEDSVNHSKPLFLLGGGMYLFWVFLGWLFLEEKKYAFMAERFIRRQAVWFYAFFSIIFTIVIYFSLKVDPILALAASIGTTFFFIADGFKKNAEEKEQQLLNPNLGAWSKILYLEVLDASFSIDGVIGAFAFTISIPLIILGNGLGAIIVRQITIRGINVISKLAYLKNGAMYSIGILGGLMILESFGKEYPFWFAPLNTLALLSFFLYLSWRQIKTSASLVKK